ncbi:hypothetical protein SERLA73DRAFT_101917 [Serpula lacrymans var. lacrymans S7.3]|uniref:Cytochrome P450 n=2 Tax=Serpula lacrymans var. lacrymans TaxID=341189 RepID=F8PIP1_SERL3|nr:uncharacterized protein SERLADRAFT_433524 [Serpula lacrymans var. lacrymans S7.9]EGO03674.1 hypothetical protein SERLA73DRAFT_101917 [Serpula lacrymans var. lacrymans S7.3]EGO29537.1 hypothetical protein SERLADRAFT_433524 [Serpula lacrymans var. lacrymans S7.9]
MEAIKAVTSDRIVFRKDAVTYEPLNIYGKNIVGTDQGEWKRHRTVAAPAFSEANNALVWAETIRIMSDWFNQLDTAQRAEKSASNSLSSDLTVEMVAPMTQITLLITSVAGFGRQVSWDDDSSDVPAPGYALTFRSAMIAAVENVMFRMLPPDWFTSFSSVVKVPYLSARILQARQAFDELGSYMLELVSSARASVTEGRSSASRAALLHNLVEANMSPEGDSKCLSDSEVLSNTFVFLLAGHETSAHTLSFAISLLALYPEAQGKIYEEVRKIWPEGDTIGGSTSSYKDFPQLPYTLAFFRETLRLFPPVIRLPRDVHTDVMLPAQRLNAGAKGSVTPGESFSVAVPAGSIVVIDIWALHMNPLYWGDDVEDFKPARFIDSDTYRWPRDAFLAFSGGPRSCIGQRFALTESICILASLVHRYEVLIPENLMHKPFEEQREAMLNWTPGLTLVPTNANVRLRRRT